MDTSHPEDLSDPRVLFGISFIKCIKKCHECMIAYNCDGYCDHMKCIYCKDEYECTCERENYYGMFWIDNPYCKPSAPPKEMLYNVSVLKTEKYVGREDKYITHEKCVLSGSFDTQAPDSEFVALFWAYFNWNNYNGNICHDDIELLKPNKWINSYYNALVTAFIVIKEDKNPEKKENPHVGKRKKKN